MHPEAPSSPIALPLPQLLSVVIPLYNSQAHLASLQQQLEAWATIVKLDVVLADDASTDATPAAFEEHDAWPSCRYFRLHPNRGQHYATAFGIQQARAELCLTIDDDVQLSPETLIHLLQHLQHTQADLVYARYPRKAWHTWRHWGSRGLACLFRWRHNCPVDPSPLRLLRRGLMPQNLPEKSFFLDTLLVARAQKVTGISVPALTSKQASRYTLLKLGRMARLMWRKE